MKHLFFFFIIFELTAFSSQLPEYLREKLLAKYNTSRCNLINVSLTWKEGLFRISSKDFLVNDILEMAKAQSIFLPSPIFIGVLLDGNKDSIGSILIQSVSRRAQQWYRLGSKRKFNAIELKDRKYIA